MGIFNFSNQEETAWMQESGTFENMLTGEKMEVKDIPIPGHDFYWIKGQRS